MITDEEVIIVFVVKDKKYKLNSISVFFLMQNNFISLLLAAKQHR